MTSARRTAELGKVGRWEEGQRRRTASIVATSWHSLEGAQGHATPINALLHARADVALPRPNDGAVAKAKHPDPAGQRQGEQRKRISRNSRPLTSSHPGS